MNGRPVPGRPRGVDAESPTLARPTARDVHVWRVELRGDSDRYVASLSAAERVRHARLRHERRDQFAISHGAVRQVLGAYLGRDARDVPLDAASGRPPSVPGLELSLTHCDELALLAVAVGPVGVDIEALNRVEPRDLRELADTTLSAAELTQFLLTPADQQVRAWLRSWVRKEAVLKSRGVGIGGRPPRELDVSLDRVDEVTIVDIDIGPAHVGAAAITPPAERIVLRDWIDRSRSVAAHP